MSPVARAVAGGRKFKGRPVRIATPTLASMLPDGVTWVDGVLVDLHNAVVLSAHGFVYFDPVTSILHILSLPSAAPVDSAALAAAADAVVASLPPSDQAGVVVEHASALGARDVLGANYDATPLRHLGRGAYGEVGLFRDARTRQLVAVKRMQLEYDPRRMDVARRKLTECKLLQASSAASPDIVHFLGAFVTVRGASLTLHLCMEYMNLGSLATVAERWGPVPEGPLADITVMLLRGLRYLQTISVMHRDFRPENVLLNSDGRAKVADLGHAKTTTSRRPDGAMTDSTGLLSLADPALAPAWAAHSPIGNKLYMAPERLDVSRRVGAAHALQLYDEKCDIWSLGLVLRVAAMAGDGYPYDVSQCPSLLDMAAVIVASPAPVMPRAAGHTRAFCDFVDLCMAKDPSARPSAVDLFSLEFMRYAVEQDGARLALWITNNLQRESIERVRSDPSVPPTPTSDADPDPPIPWSPAFSPLLSPAPTPPSEREPISRDTSIDDIAVLSRPLPRDATTTTTSSPPPSRSLSAFWGPPDADLSTSSLDSPLAPSYTSTADLLAELERRLSAARQQEADLSAAAAQALLLGNAPTLSPRSVADTRHRHRRRKRHSTHSPRSASATVRRTPGQFSFHSSKQKRN